METVPITHNVFAARLLQYIITHHPERMADTSFIEERASAAARSFETASLAGMTVDEAMREADATLYRGLLFSPFLLVRDILETSVGYTEDDPELDDFALQMLQLVTPVVERYAPDDSFMGSTAYNALRNDMIQSINQYLISNGIQ